MASTGQKNFKNFLYVDDNAVHWTKRGEDEGVRAAIDGNAAAAGDPMWFDSPRMRARHVTLEESTTFRQKRVLVYTTAAFAAITIGQVVSFQIEGDATAVDYKVVGKTAEKQGRRLTGHQLADHA